MSYYDAISGRGRCSHVNLDKLQSARGRGQGKSGNGEVTDGLRAEQYQLFIFLSNCLYESGREAKDEGGISFYGALRV